MGKSLRAVIVTALSLVCQGAGAQESVEPNELSSKLFAQVAQNSSVDGSNVEAPRELPPLALDILMAFEGWSSDEQDFGFDFCTIGYGHLIARKPCAEVPDEVAQYDPPISLEEGLALLKQDTVKARLTVAKLVTSDISDEQFGALVSFAFNVGTGPRGFSGSKMLRLLNDEEFNMAAKEFPKWIKIKDKVNGTLVTRRSCELDLFLETLSAPFRPEDCITLGTAPAAKDLINIETGRPD
ncbi:lysozyme [Mesorhizobium calcicola]|uniref:Lysozyme n=1 Tax=Mesorhizobium calcicola TaxID=1300310 RepID=A0ABW4WNP7_9HYPH